MPSTPFILKQICELKDEPITTFARRIGIDAASASQAYKGTATLTLGMMEKILAEGGLLDSHKALLVKAFVEDMLSDEARSLIVIAVKPNYSESSVMREDGPDERFKRDMTNLESKARGNPALARALSNLAKVVSGDHVAVE